MDVEGVGLNEYRRFSGWCVGVNRDMGLGNGEWGLGRE